MIRKINLWTRSQLGDLNCRRKRHLGERLVGNLWCLIEWGHSRALLPERAQPIFNANEEKEIFICCEKSAFHYKKELKRVRKQPLAQLGWNRAQRKKRGFRVARTAKSGAIVFVLVLRAQDYSSSAQNSLTFGYLLFSWAMIFVSVGRECVESFSFVLCRNTWNQTRRGSCAEIVLIE